MSPTADVLEQQPAAAPADRPANSSLAYAWYVVIVLMSCYTLSFVNRQILTLLFAPIKHDLAISDTLVGLLQGFAFAIFYTVFGVPIGRIADTSNRRNLIAAGIFLWSIMTCLCAAAGSFWSLFFMRIGVGIGEASLSPAAFSLITDYIPKKRLARAISVYQMGIFIGTGIALIVGGSVVDATLRLKTVAVPILGVIASWRLSFIAVGLPGFLFVLWLYTIKEPARRGALRAADGNAPKLSLSQVYAQGLMRWQSIVGISLAMIVQSLCSYAFSSWGPAFFQRVHGWSAGQTGRSLGFIMLICGCVGMYIGGTLSDRWQQRGMAEAPLKVGVISAVGTGILFVTAMLAAQRHVVFDSHRAGSPVFGHAHRLHIRVSPNDLAQSGTRTNLRIRDADLESGRHQFGPADSWRSERLRLPQRKDDRPVGSDNDRRGGYPTIHNPARNLRALSAPLRANAPRKPRRGRCLDRLARRINLWHTR